MHKRSAIRLIVLDELSLLIFVLRSLFGLPTLVVNIAPIFAPLQPIIFRVFRLVRQRSAPGLEQLSSLAETLRNRPHLWKTTDLYISIEPNAEAVYDFEDISGCGYRLAYPYKNVTANHLQWHVRILHALIELSESAAHERFRYVATSQHQADIFRPALRNQKNLQIDSPHRWYVPTNFLYFIAVVLLGWMRCLRWAQIDAVAPKKIYMGFDAITDPRLLTSLNEMVDDPSNALGVFRNATHRDDGEGWFAPYPTCPLFDGALPARQVIKAGLVLLKETLSLFLRFRNLDTRHAYRILKFPLIELTYRALMEKYRFQFFFGRDDYNVEHIFRSWEMRKHGGRSLGINHGTPYYPIVDPVWRYLDFDSYYSFGTDLYRDHYADRWPSHMKILSVGSFGLTREQHETIQKVRPTGNIGVFIKTFDDGMEPSWAADIVPEIAAAFPEWRIIVKPKTSDLRSMDKETKARLMAKAPNNVEIIETKSYDVMTEIKYCVTTPSTIVMEAIHFGLISLCYDVFDEHSPLQFRGYPELCYRTSSEIISRIKACESGDWAYPREAYAGLIDISGRYAYDTIREDLSRQVEGM